VDVDPLKAFALFAPEDLEEEAPRELGRDQGVLQGAPRSGERLDERYVLTESLGQGGMGLVFRGRDETLGRDVAVKVLLLEGEGPRRRFEREAEVTANLQARHVIRVFASGFCRGYPYIVYELIEGGQTLVEAFAAEPLERRLELMEEVAEGLASAHAHGVIHRDLKPENVLVRPTGEAVVLDFGLAGVARSSLTRTGEVMGTPAYMAPEQLRGLEATSACDVWALGLMLHEALYLEHPFLVGETILPVLMGRIAEASFQLPEGGPPALRALIKGCVVSKPERRPPDAAAFLSELRAARAAPTRVRSPVASALALGAGALSLVAGGLWFASRDAGPPLDATPRASATSTPTPAASSPPPRATPAPTPESAESLFQRGMALAEGDPPQDYEGGLQLMAQAADRGHLEAIYQIGRYMLLSGVEGGQAKAEVLFRRAAAEGHAASMWRLAMLADDAPETGNEREALEWYRRAAEAGHVAATYTYALTLIEGAHGKKEPQRGMRFLEAAAARGHAPAKCQLALRIVTGDHGSKADPPRAIRLLEEAVRGDHPLAKFVLGMWLTQGRWAFKDVERGEKLIREAAAQGDPDALEYVKALGPPPAAGPPPAPPR
jgi:eukaryotic-like serine/threonine-protein kinase